MTALATLAALLEDIPSGLGDVLSVGIALVCFGLFWLLIEGLRKI